MTSVGIHFYHYCFHWKHCFSPKAELVYSFLSIVCIAIPRYEDGQEAVCHNAWFKCPLVMYHHTQSCQQNYYLLAHTHLFATWNATLSRIFNLNKMALLKHWNIAGFVLDLKVVRANYTRYLRAIVWFDIIVWTFSITDFCTTSTIT